MKPLKISRLELWVLLLFGAGLLVNAISIQLAAGTLVILYLFGIAFEFLTDDAWHYHPSLRLSTFAAPDRDVNWILGLGWVGALILGIVAGRALFGLLGWPSDSIWAAVVGLGIVGNLLEQIYLALGLWSYAYDHWICRMLLPKAVVLLDIPLSVRLGYFWMGAVVWTLIEIVRWIQ